MTNPRATLLHDYADVNTDPHHKLYRLEPGGDLPEFVIVSVFRYPSSVRGRRAQEFEARFLLADARGDVVGDFAGLGDEYTGDHDDALMGDKLAQGPYDWKRIEGKIDGVKLALGKMRDTAR